MSCPGNNCLFDRHCEERSDAAISAGSRLFGQTEPKCMHSGSRSLKRTLNQRNRIATLPLVGRNYGYINSVKNKLKFTLYL